MCDTSMIKSPSRDDPNTVERMKKIAMMTPAESHRSCRDACASLSNCNNEWGAHKNLKLARVTQILWREVDPEFW
jgi:hypothetical protein